MNGWAGTRAEREWLAVLRRIDSALERVADNWDGRPPGVAPQRQETPYSRFLAEVQPLGPNALRVAGSWVEDLAAGLRDSDHADRPRIEVLEAVTTLLYELTNPSARA